MRRLLVLILVCVLMLSCAKNPFSARDSEPPSEEAGTFVPPTSPEIVLENLRLAYEEMVIGNYIECLDSNFIFVFDFVEGSLVDTSWNHAVEINLTGNLFADFRGSDAVKQLSVEFFEQVDQQDVLLDSTAMMIRSYLVTVADSAGQVLESYEGVAQFDLVEAAFNFWSIARWEDLHLDTRSPSWADLKNSYR
ncbi:MAG: hypothetical protein ABIJ61_00075 [bacterium]